jgi:hypothetical protein
MSLARRKRPLSLRTSNGRSVCSWTNCFLYSPESMITLHIASASAASLPMRMGW